MTEALGFTMGHAFDWARVPVDLSLAEDLAIIRSTVDKPEGPLEDFVAELNRRARDDWDNLVILIGERGAGKSTTALELARRVDPHFTLDRIAYLPHEILDISEAIPDGSAMVVDEVGEAWGSSDYASQINRTLRKAFIGNRYRNLTFLFCCPTFADAASGLRNLARFMVDVKSRHLAVAYDLKRDNFLPRSYPFRYTKFMWSRVPLPGPVYSAYARVKEERGTARLKAYRDQIEAAAGGISVDVAMEEVLADTEKFINSQGWVDQAVVFAYFQDRGLTKKEAKAVAVQGSKVTRPKWVKEQGSE